MDPTRPAGNRRSAGPGDRVGSAENHGAASVRERWRQMTGNKDSQFRASKLSGPISLVSGFPVWIRISLTPMALLRSDPTQKPERDVWIRRYAVGVEKTVR